MPATAKKSGERQATPAARDRRGASEERGFSLTLPLGQRGGWGIGRQRSTTALPTMATAGGCGCEPAAQPPAAGRSAFLGQSRLVVGGCARPSDRRAAWPAPNPGSGRDRDRAAGDRPAAARPVRGRGPPATAAPRTTTAATRRPATPARPPHPRRRPRLPVPSGGRRATAGASAAAAHPCRGDGRRAGRDIADPHGSPQSLVEARPPLRPALDRAVEHGERSAMPDDGRGGEPRCRCRRRPFAPGRDPALDHANAGGQVVKGGVAVPSSSRGEERDQDQQLAAHRERVDPAGVLGLRREPPAPDREHAEAEQDVRAHEEERTSERDGRSGRASGAVHERQPEQRLASRPGPQRLAAAVVEDEQAERRDHGRHALPPCRRHHRRHHQQHR